jgi:hypothetical protein
MQLVTRSAVERYLATDPIAALAASLAHSGDRQLTCQRWLDESAPKRMAYEWLYGDLLKNGPRRRVLDVGGGLTAFTRELARRHDYVLLDLLAHDGAQAASYRDSLQASQLQALDWYEYRPEAPFDVVIANDLFPNVDQRLALFLERFLGQARELRLSLTWYDAPRFYQTRRVGAEELLCMLAWDGRQTRATLERFGGRVRDAAMDLFEARSESVYPNGRQVCLVRLDGNAGTQ